MRPSIIVGDHRTGWTAAFNVLYTPLRAFEAGVIPVVPARKRSPVDVVPVDYVADAVHALAQAPEAAGQTLHVVAGASASTVGEIVRLAGERFSARQPRIVPPWVYRAVIGKIVDKRAPASARRMLASNEVYFSYFDDARALRRRPGAGDPRAARHHARRRCGRTSTGSWTTRRRHGGGGARSPARGSRRSA